MIKSAVKAAARGSCVSNKDCSVTITILIVYYQSKPIYAYYLTYTTVEGMTFFCTHCLFCLKCCNDLPRSPNSKQ